MSEDWAQRQMCPDGGCIGVIGPDGTCKVCGRAAPNWGEERKRGLIEPEDDEDDEDDGADAEAAADEQDDSGDYDDDEDGDDDEDDDDEDDDDDDDDDDADAEAEAEAEADSEDDPEADRAAAAAHDTGWKKRKLCSDGSCIGVIGSDGKCKVCGRSAG